MRKIIVNLESETERYQHFLRYNITAERLSPVPLDNEELLDLYGKTIRPNKNESKRKKEISNLLTFRNIIKQAKSDNEKYVLRLEDDVEFISDIEPVLKRIESLPDEFALCHLGTYFRKSKNGVLTKYNEHFLELGTGLKTWGLQAIVFNNNIFDKILKDFEDKETYKRTLDYYIQTSIVGHYRCFVCYPIIALQKEEFVKNSMHKLRFDRKLYLESESVINDYLKL